MFTLPVINAQISKGAAVENTGYAKVILPTKAQSAKLLTPESSVGQRPRLGHVTLGAMASMRVTGGGRHWLVASGCPQVPGRLLL